MRKLFLAGLVACSLATGPAAAAQAGISLGAAVGTVYSDNKLGGGDWHGLLYLRLGVPLVPYGARGDVMVFDDSDGGMELAVIGNAVLSLSTPLIQPYALVGIGRYGLGENAISGVSFGAGVRVGGRRGLFLEGRRHDPINRTLVSFGIAF